MKYSVIWRQRQGVSSWEIYEQKGLIGKPTKKVFSEFLFGQLTLQTFIETDTEYAAFAHCLHRFNEHLKQYFWRNDLGQL